MIKSGCVKLFLFFALEALVFPAFSAADGIYCKLKSLSRVADGSSASESLPLRMEDAWGIVLGETRDFLRGIEIQLTIPEEANIYTGTYAVFVYRRVSPQPDTAVSQYEGSPLFFKVIEERRRLFLHLPFESSSGFSPAPDTYLHRTALTASDFPLLFAILPVMKGIPEQAAAAVFRAEVRPLFKNLGRLLLSFAGNSSPDAGTRVFIDDSEKGFSPKGFLLEPGIHRLRVEKTGSSPFLATVGIERGKTEPVAASFPNNASSVRINVPSGSSVFLDGLAVLAGGAALPVQAGEHTVSVKVGDYQISKRFSVEPGKNYSVSISLDVLIHEE
ncbi:MAG: PEGA domain-containing protein [Spirochaetales bacterium]|jgi:hypothetical protein|nr:PEGA domain-containing protein [Spirochaetales bacterium]